MTILLNLIVALGMVVVVPLGLRLIGGLPDRPRRWWLAGALPGAASLWLPRGIPAAVLACPYGLITAALAGLAARRLVTLRGWSTGLARELAICTALGTPAIAAGALVAERSGVHLFGFKRAILSLTVAHFHFAGFAAALIASLVCGALGDRPLARAAALTVPGGTAVVLLGFFAGDEVELAGAAVLTGGMWLVAWLTWREVRPHRTDRTTRWLLGASSAVLVGTMLLALDWSLGHVTPVPHLSLAWMVATHGLLNAVGFALCALLAWRRIAAGARSDLRRWVESARQP